MRSPPVMRRSCGFPLNDVRAGDEGEMSGAAPARFQFLGAESQDFRRRLLGREHRGAFADPNPSRSPPPGEPHRSVTAGRMNRSRHPPRTRPTFLLAQGVDARTIMETLGHSQISLTLNTYSHVLPVLQRLAATKMDSMLSGLG